MREMKDSGIDRLGKIPVDWTIPRIKHIFKEIGSGTTPSSGKEIYYENGEYFWIQSGDLYKTKIIVDTEKKLTELAVNTFSALKEYTADFLVIAMYGASIGNVSISKIDARTNQACCAIKPKENVDFKFLYYTLCNDKDIMIDMSIGGTQPNISQTKILELPVPLPSKAEQIKIVAYLEGKCAEIDSIVSDIQAQIETLEEYKRSVITEAVTKGLDPDVEMKDSGIEWIGEIPKHWEINKIKNIGSVRNGLTYTPQDLCDDGILVLRSSNVQNGKLSLLDNVYVSCCVKPELMVKKGDILICSRNGSRELIGKNAIISEDINAAFGAFMMIFRCDSPKYMYYILNSNIFSYYLGTFFTSTINQLTGSNFNNMKVVYCPDLDEQNEIVDYLDSKCAEIDGIITDKEQQIETIEEYKKSLIFEYVTGKKEVRV